MPTIGWLSRMLPSDPKNRASPNVNTPPSDDTSQNPALVGVAAIATIGRFGGCCTRDPSGGAPPKFHTSPSPVASQYPATPDSVMATTRPVFGWSPRSPTWTASPKVKTRPNAVANAYPRPVGVALIPTTWQRVATSVHGATSCQHGALCSAVWLSVALAV